MAQRPIIGSIVERKPSSVVSTPSTLESGRTGFPPVQHRSKSTFARNREENRKPKPRRNDPPIVHPTPKSPPQPSDGWRDQISRENEARVASMTNEEREEERRQILERFGANIGDVLNRARLARGKQSAQKSSSHDDDTKVESSEEPIPITAEEPKLVDRAISPPPSALVSPSGSRPASRADRRLRFAELDPKDVYVYEGAPPSPRRRVLALPPPDPNRDPDAISLGQWKGKMSTHPYETSSSDNTVVQPQTLPEPGDDRMVEEERADPVIPPKEREEPEEGTPEYIRRRFFPSAPRNNPNMAWLELSSSSVSPEPSSSTSLRFDLHGSPIPPSVSSTLPTHLGLHHHAEGSHAGYTLDDIFLLSRSTVPAQRATMFGVLARIAENISPSKIGKVAGFEELFGKEEIIRKRILGAGLEALSERGSVGARAIEVVWQCLVGWDEELFDLEGIELTGPKSSLLDTLPFEHLLPQIATVLSGGDALPESANQLLSVLHRLAQQSNQIAAAIVETVSLLPTVVQAFLLMPPSAESGAVPNPLALQFLHTLCLASRSNALEIRHFADSFLRFITFLPSSSPYPPDLSVTLIISTLRLYTILAAYGLGCSAAGLAVEPFARLEQYVTSTECTSRSLQMAWMNLIESWTICAVDPHRTTPPHDIRWSQVAGWGWMVSLTELEKQWSTSEADQPLWAACWRAQASQLEGFRVNSVKGGEGERALFLSESGRIFRDGPGKITIQQSLDALDQFLTSSSPPNETGFKKIRIDANAITAALRVYSACLPNHSDTPLEILPLDLPLDKISQLCSKLIFHPIWTLWNKPGQPFASTSCRSLSSFLSAYVQLSARLPDISQDLWTAQALAVLLRLGPGDEEAALKLFRRVELVFNADWAEARGMNVPAIIWDRGGLAILGPFIENTVKPSGNPLLGPLSITPQSIQESMTQRLPAHREAGLPLRRDWSFTPLDHLLRSADSDVFKTLPDSWNATEVEVTRATLFLTSIVRAVLSRYSLSPLSISCEEAEFGCMQVFMLEHGQAQADSSEEVFRDTIVERFIADILHPYQFGALDREASTVVHEPDLEKVATRFLGPSIPFFQFYTDFVALYDSISFSHPLFASLLLPPTSMNHPVDYRKHLWCDFGHVLRTVRISPSHVLSGDLSMFLYPIEQDPQVITAYLGCLVKSQINDFVKLVALHHLASNIWPDLRGEEQSQDGRASQLLKAILAQGDFSVVREVIRYRQTRAGPLLLPPDCFPSLGDLKESRVECVRRLAGEAAVERLNALFTE